MTGRTARGLSWLKTVTFLSAAFFGCKALFGMVQPDPGKVAAEALMAFFGTVLVIGIPAFVLGWVTGKNSDAASTCSIDKDSRKPTIVKTTTNDAYAEALAEVEEGRVDKGTWARCYAVSDGDESKTKARYIKARVSAIGAAAAWVDTQPPIANVAVRNDGHTQSKNSSPASNSSTSLWWLAGVAVIGFVAARVLSAYQNDTHGQVAASPVQAPTPNPSAGIDWDKGVITLPEKPADKLPMADMSQFTPKNQRHMAVEALSRADYANALEVLRILAAQGDAWAQNNLGVMYSSGNGVEQNYVEAVKWHKLAVSQGDATAQFNLGAMYAQGQGVPQNYAEAVKWYQLAASEGYADAQFNLAVMYDEGQAMAQNYAEAVRWYRLAASQGNALAQSNLGIKYALGRGVGRDDIRGHMWLSLAAASAIPGAVKGRDSLAKEMSPPQIAQAQQMARDCQQRNFKGCD